jgi:hypothetical protein
VNAGICLGNIGCEAAAKALERRLEDELPFEGVAWAMSMLCWRQKEFPTIERYINLVEDNSEIAGQMVVSLALRQHPIAEGIAKRGIAARDPFFRGASAIALAYCRSSSAANELRGLADEAATDIERVLFAAAEVLAGHTERGGMLTKALQGLEIWPQLRPFWRYHVLAALRLAAQRHLDPRLVELWAEISGDNKPRIDSLVAEFTTMAAR